MLKKNIDNILDNYLNQSKETFGNNDLASKIRNNYSYDINAIFSKNRNIFSKCSPGQGQWAKIPWLGVFDTRMTSTATKGIYVCILFKEDMSGFYLTLNQGVTYLNKNYAKIKIPLNREVKKWILGKIESKKDFIEDSIALYSSKEAHLNYEDTTIISKYYEKNNYNHRQLMVDLKDIVSIYTDLLDNHIIDNYSDIITSFVDEIQNGENNGLFDIDNTTSDMIHEIMEEENVDVGEVVLIETLPPSAIKKTREKTQKKILRKVDFLEKSKKKIKIGFLGEQLVLTHEKQNLINNGRADLADKVKWVSQNSDGYGYDVLSYDNNGKEKYIEVKTTKLSNINHPFEISKNEILTSEKKGHSYWIYRVYELGSKMPKFYKIQGSILENFDLDAKVFDAYIK